jgi:hypothetical protein
MFEEGIRGIRVCVRSFGDSQDSKMRFIWFEEVFGAGIRSRYSKGYSKKYLRDSQDSKRHSLVVAAQRVHEDPQNPMNLTFECCESPKPRNTYKSFEYSRLANRKLHTYMKKNPQRP